MIHEVVAVGPLACNCQILADERSKEALIIDPGDDADEILSRVKGFTVRAILHTHCHFDHMTATRAVAEATGAEICIHKSDLAYYEGLKAQYAQYGRSFGLNAKPAEPLNVGRFLKDGESIAFGPHRVNVLFTPGHTEGSCSFHIDGHVFSGDTLFRGSIGRTDLPGGNFELEADSIRTKLYALDPETQVWPGHGAPTSIAAERAENPFVRG